MDFVRQPGDLLSRVRRCRPRRRWLPPRDSRRSRHGYDQLRVEPERPCRSGSGFRPTAGQLYLSGLGRDHQTVESGSTSSEAADALEKAGAAATDPEWVDGACLRHDIRQRSIARHAKPGRGSQRSHGAVTSQERKGMSDHYIAVSGLCSRRWRAIDGR